MTNHNQEAAIARREAFIHDLVEVFKKHRVMIEPDGLDVTAEEVWFAEHANHSVFNFIAELPEVEHAVRQAVWPIVHP
jgi:hypothetical protein